MSLSFLSKTGDPKAILKELPGEAEWTLDAMLPVTLLAGLGIFFYL